MLMAFDTFTFKSPHIGLEHLLYFTVCRRVSVYSLINVIFYPKKVNAGKIWGFLSKDRALFKARNHYICPKDRKCNGKTACVDIDAYGVRRLLFMLGEKAIPFAKNSAYSLIDYMNDVPAFEESELMKKFIYTEIVITSNGIPIKKDREISNDREETRIGNIRVADKRLVSLVDILEHIGNFTLKEAKSKAKKLNNLQKTEYLFRGYKIEPTAMVKASDAIHYILINYPLSEYKTEHLRTLVEYTGETTTELLVFTDEFKGIEDKLRVNDDRLISTIDILREIGDSVSPNRDFSRLLEENNKSLGCYLHSHVFSNGNSATVIEPRGLTVLFDLISGQKAESFKIKNLGILVRFLERRNYI